MSRKIKIGALVLSEMNKFLENEKRIGQKAQPADMLFIKDGSWLKDTAVIDEVRNKEGRWDVLLIFAHYKNPLQLIVRNITQCFSEQKALAAAFYLCKQAAKDRRGTLHVSLADLGLCPN